MENRSIYVGEEPWPEGWENSAYRISGYQNIYENEKSFWISDISDNINLDMIILKKTLEGIELRTLINKRESQLYISDWLSKLALKNMTYEQFCLVIDDNKRKSFEMGFQSYRNKILKLL